ncbi:MAG: restriction endonuclease [Betaproteobacteria bacterium]|nr:restriction endonuclease [Betaproteobacteria bacterium]
MTNRLYYGDNLEILRKEIKDETVDLIYLDPPFNSKRDYNLLFRTPKGHESDAQITAFEDTWHWGPQAEREFFELQQQPNTDVAQMMQALRDFLGTNDMMAYLTMMANRLLEMQRVLKPTGSLYLHCDPTASHYLKIVLDGVFGKEQFKNEIVWRRTGAHNATKSYGPIHDIILFYTKFETYTFNLIRRPYMRGHVESRYTKQLDGRYKFTSGGNVLTGAGVTSGPSGEVWRGFNPTKKKRHWAVPTFYEDLMPEDYKKLNSVEKLEALYKAGLIEIDGKSEWPIMVRYLGERDGTVLQDIWAYQPYTEGTVAGTETGIDEDVKWYGPTDPDRLGYPTQKPLGLLERIVQVSSNEGDVVLDPFCGCGTAVHAAEKLKRRWIGIDITHLAVSLIERRMKKAFPYLEAVTPGSKKAMQAGPNAFEVIGVPHDLEAARDLATRDKHQFQLWAVSLVGAQPYRGGVKGSDKGIDGLIFPEVAKSKTEKIVVSVKGGETVGAAMVRDLKGVLSREKAAIGLFVTLASPTKEMVKEAAAAGMYESPHHGAFPKLQILTIEGLLSGKQRAQYPDMAYGAQTFKHAKKEEGVQQQKGLF